MRIISNFKDYYDVGMQYGFDPQLPYLRVRQEIKSSKYDYRSKYPWYGKRNPDSFEFVYIGFAGKLYPCADGSLTYDEKIKPTWVFDFESISEETLSVFLKRHRDECGKWVRQEKKWEWERAQSIKGLKKRFDVSERPELFRLFEEYNTAIFVYHTWDEKIVINERLNQYDFQKVLPPMEAFQELAMYVGSYLTKPTIETPPIDDKTMAEIKGFDMHSFRKPKQNKKS